jgi:hypothetical protein
MRDVRLFAKQLSFLLLAAALACAIACDRSGRTAHTVTITGPIHVYKTENPPTTYPGTDFITQLGPSDHPTVLETKSGNGYRAAKIRLADGREGWVFSGEAVDIQ